MKSDFRIIFLSLSCFFLLNATAQDTRVVSQPQIPPACSILVSTTTLKDLDTQNDQSKIQSAIDTCPKGHSVHLTSSNEHNVFVSGPIQIKSGVTLIIDKGTTLFAINDAQLYDTGANTCGTTNHQGRGCKPFITLDSTASSAIMGLGVIDGQGNRVVKGLNETWWQIARRAQKENSEHNVPRLIEIRNSGDFTLYQITLKNSPNFHVTLKNVDGFTAWGIKIDSPAMARNTDGIDPISSKNITITKSFIRTGDDSVAIKAGEAGMSESISIIDNHFFNGHGMSIGSETSGGVRNVLIDQLTLDGGNSGIRIKSDVSRGGAVEHIRYNNICMRNIRLPIEITSLYNPKAVGNSKPKYIDIEMNSVFSLTPGKVLLAGLPNTIPFEIKYQNVKIVGAEQLSVSNSIAPQEIDFQANRQELRKLCEPKMLPFPETPITTSRPELTEKEAAKFQMHEIFQYAGTPEAEIIDAWNPLFVQPPRADYVVDQSLTLEDATHFKTIQNAINQMVKDLQFSDSQKRVFLEVHPGVYTEVVYIPSLSNPISMYGIDQNPLSTVIRFNLDAAVSGQEYAKKVAHEFKLSEASIQEMFNEVKSRNNITTFGTATLWTRNEGFQISNITIENNYVRGNPNCTTDCNGYLPNAMHQAVALMVDGADRSIFKNIRLLGLQDTLYLKNKPDHQTSRSYFESDYIEGDVDFIFGDATAYFLATEIKSLSSRKDSYVAAPSTHVHSHYGFVFDHCRFTSDNGKFSEAGQYRLARQWFHNQKCTPYGFMAIKNYSCTIGSGDHYTEPHGEISTDTLQNVGKMVVMNSTIGKHISKTHPWSDWNPMGKLSHRPVQYSFEEYLKNLQEIGAPQELILIENSRSKQPSPFLSEYQNTWN